MQIFRIQIRTGLLKQSGLLFRACSDPKTTEIRFKMALHPMGDADRTETT